MGLVDLQTLNAVLRVPSLELVRLLLWRVPETAVVDGGDVQVLSDSVNPGWDSVNRATGWQGH